MIYHIKYSKRNELHDKLFNRQNKLILPNKVYTISYCRVKTPKLKLYSVITPNCMI